MTKTPPEKPKPEFMSFELPKDASAVTRELILSYLVFNCYEETAKSFAKAILHGKTPTTSVLSSSSKSKHSADKTATETMMAIDSQSFNNNTILSATSNESIVGPLISDKLLISKIGNSWDSIIPSLMEVQMPQPNSTSSSSETSASTSKIVTRSKTKSSIISKDSTSESIDADGDFEMGDTQIPGSSKQNKTRINATASNEQHSLSLTRIIASLSPRKEICKYINDGDADKAIQMCYSVFPQILVNLDDPSFASDYSKLSSREIHSTGPLMTSFLLHSQCFIELIRLGKQSEALLYGQNVLRKFGDVNQEVLETVRDVGALLAYENPQESPLSYLLSQDRRNNVARAVNSAVMLSLKQSSMPALEMIIQQATLAMEYVNEDKDASNARPKRYSSASKLADKKWTLQDLLSPST